MPPEAVSARLGRAAIMGSAALGAFIAGLADSVVKKEASAIGSISEFMYRVFGLGNAPTGQLAYGLVLVVVIATLLTLVFDASSKRTAFGLGIGILSTCLTITPYKAPDPIVEESASRLAPAEGGPTLLDQLLGVTPAWAQVGVPGTVHLVVSMRVPSKECTVILTNLRTRRVVGRSRYLGKTEFRIPLAPGRYQLDLLAPGARSTSYPFTVTSGKTIELRAELGAQSAVRTIG